MSSSSKIGLPPGSLIYTGKSQSRDVEIYATQFNTKSIHTSSEITTPANKHNLWLDINGVHNIEIIQQVGDLFGIHPLTIEDISNPNQRPKLEIFKEYIFLELNLIDYDKNTEKVYKEQVALILGKNYVITLQESSKDIFKKVKSLLNDKNNPLRKKGADYLAYSIVDFIVDHYFLIVDEILEDAENIEVELLSDFSTTDMDKIYMLKKNILLMKKYTRPLNDAMNSFLNLKSNLIKPQTRLYSKDIQDHLLRISDHIEHLSNVATEMIKLFQSNTSNRMNEIMKTLTLVGTIFIPLTFITGLYGMNFKYMPELNLTWGYPVLLGVFIGITGALLVYFKRKNWF